MAHIVFEDQEIRAIWHDGSSDFLLVTFGDLYSRVDEDRFFADGPVIKSGLTCLGIVAKRPNWFPSKSMQRLRAAVADALTGHATRVAYGGSMGGYAAIKHASLLGATHVIALCPQWSIDPAQCEGRYLPWGHYFRPAMAGMEIRREDASGRVVVFADPRFAVDEFHRNMIAQAWPELVSIDVTSSDHHVTSIIAGTQNLNDLIAAVRTLPPDGILAVVNVMRRRSWYRGEVVLRRAMARYPRLVARILITRARADAGYRGLRLSFYLDVLRALLGARAWLTAARFALAFVGLFWRRGPRRLAASLREVGALVRAKVPALAG